MEAWFNITALLFQSLKIPFCCLFSVVCILTGIDHEVNTLTYFFSDYLTHKEHNTRARATRLVADILQNISTDWLLEKEGL